MEAQPKTCYKCSETGHIVRCLFLQPFPRIAPLPLCVTDLGPYSPSVDYYRAGSAPPTPHLLLADLVASATSAVSTATLLVPVLPPAVAPVAALAVPDRVAAAATTAVVLVTFRASAPRPPAPLPVASDATTATNRVTSAASAPSLRPRAATDVVTRVTSRPSALRSLPKTTLLFGRCSQSSGPL